MGTDAGMTDRRPESNSSPDDAHEEDVIDEMRGSSVGTEDPNIVGDSEPGLVDDEVGDGKQAEV